MATTMNESAPFAPVRRAPDRPLHAATSPMAPLARRRIIASAALGVCALAFGIVMSAIFGAAVIPIVWVPLTLGLIVLGASSDMLRSDERPRASVMTPTPLAG